MPLPMQMFWDWTLQLRSWSWRVLARVVAVAQCLSQPAEFLLHVHGLIVRPHPDDTREDTHPNITTTTYDQIMEIEHEIPYEQEVDFCTMGMFIIGKMTPGVARYVFLPGAHPGPGASAGRAGMMFKFDTGSFLVSTYSRQPDSVLGLWRRRSRRSNKLCPNTQPE